MNRSLRLLSGASLVLAAPLLAACADVQDAPTAETTAAPVATEAASAATGTPLPIDTTASRVEWEAAKVTQSHDGGFRRFSGTVSLDGQTVNGADVTIHAASIFSDDERLTGHLQSPDFFSVEANPEARFRATAFAPLAPADTTGTGGATHRVTGTLAMAGQTNQVAFPATVRVAGGTVTADANFIINRQDWGLTYPGQPDDLIRDEVRIILHVVARPEAAATVR